MKKSIVLCYIIIASLILSTCTQRPPDLSVYALEEDTRFIETLVKQYNKTQKRFKITFTKIAPNELKALLENSIQRNNTSLLLAPHDISSRGDTVYFSDLSQFLEQDFQVDRMIPFVEATLAYTANFGVPIYYHNLLRNEIDAACLSLVRAMYSNEDLDAILDFFSFLSQPEVNAQALLYQDYPVYEDAGLSALTIQEAKRVDVNFYNKDFVDEELILLPNIVSLRK